MLPPLFWREDNNNCRRRETCPQSDSRGSFLDHLLTISTMSRQDQSEEGQGDLPPNFSANVAGTTTWPTLLDYSGEECSRMLRELELRAYEGVVSALRAQGNLTKSKRDLLSSLQEQLNISVERHQAEVRRATNDEKLMTIAYQTNSHSSPSSSASAESVIVDVDISSEWIEEGRRVTPVLPKLVPQTALFTLANVAAQIQSVKNASMPQPSETAVPSIVGSGGQKRKDSLSESSVIVIKKAVPSTPPSPKKLCKDMLHLPNQISQESLLSKFESTVKVKKVTASRGRKGSTSSSSPHPVLVLPNHNLKSHRALSSPLVVTSTVPQKVLLLSSSTATLANCKQTSTIVTNHTASKKDFVTVPLVATSQTNNHNGKGFVIHTAKSMPNTTSNSSSKNNCKANVILVPRSMFPSSSTSPAIGSTFPVVVNSSSTSNGPQVLISDHSTLSPTSIVNGRQPNIIEIQTSGETLENLRKKGQLSQDILSVVQKAISMTQSSNNNNNNKGLESRSNLSTVYDVVINPSPSPSTTALSTLGTSQSSSTSSHSSSFSISSSPSAPSVTTTCHGPVILSPSATSSTISTTTTDSSLPTQVILETHATSTNVTE